MQPTDSTGALERWPVTASWLVVAGHETKPVCFATQLGILAATHG